MYELERRYIKICSLYHWKIYELQKKQNNNTFNLINRVLLNIAQTCLCVLLN